MFQEDGDFRFLITVFDQLVAFPKEEHGRVFLGKEFGDELVLFIGQNRNIAFGNQFGSKILQERNRNVFFVHGDQDDIDAIQLFFVVIVFGDSPHTMRTFRVEENKKGFFACGDIIRSEGGAVRHFGEIEIRDGFDLTIGLKEGGY